MLPDANRPRPQRKRCVNRAKERNAARGIGSIGDDGKSARTTGMPQGERMDAICPAERFHRSSIDFKGQILCDLTGRRTMAGRDAW
jgi:hypothetical protein